METIAARNTVVEIASLEEASAYLNLHSRYVTPKLTKSMIALSLRDIRGSKAVGMAIFCSPRTSAMQNRYSIELLRLAFATDVRVQGGASKLISAYRDRFYPADIFTYQDTTGEATAVYEHCGFTLVSQAKTKKYLVAPGKTLATGNRKTKEILSISYATKWGPDQIVKSNLGEVYKPDGSRKSNLDLFIDELGWHVEEALGDRVYEWINPDLTFYTYKITADDSDKYYFGVSHVKKGNATIEDCTAHHYLGSGGAKFTHWRSRHEGRLHKEVLSTFSRRQEAYIEEAWLVGDLFRADPLCLNSTAGGARTALSVQQSLAVYGNQICSIHGETLFRGKKCITCTAQATVQIKACPSHGDVKHKGESCYACHAQGAVRQSLCPEHGTTTHRGSNCSKCLAEAAVSVRNCEKHGMTKHRGAICYKCTNQVNVTLAECETHGLVAHRGTACMSCAVSANNFMSNCNIHGKTMFNGSGCLRCAASSRVGEQICFIHGLTTHFGSACGKCRAESSVGIKACPVHGDVKHKGAICYTCEVESKITESHCAVHGITKFRSGNCCKCHNAKMMVMKECPVHGVVKHRGTKCSTCLAAKTKHSRWHKEEKDSSCPYCVE